jgi:hypothetical protein
MLKLFFKGLIWGTGFASAIVAILFFAEIFFINQHDNSGDVINFSNEWNSLSKEEQISDASAIAIVRYSKGINGNMIASISNIYKDNESIVIDFEIGAKYPSLDYYPRHDSRSRSGVVVFFTGSPVKERSTLYLYEERVLAYGDMPLDVLINLFKQKVEKE